MDKFIWLLQYLELLKNKYESVKASGASQFNPGWHEAIAMRNLLITAEAVTKSALSREESRGAHTREDFPGERKGGYTYNTIISKNSSGKMELKKQNRAEPDQELKRIAESSLEDLEKEVSREQS